MTAPNFAALRKRVLGSGTADGDSVYLPGLEPCLRGDVLLLSWHDAYFAVSNLILDYRNHRFKSSLATQSSKDGDDETLLSFIVDPEVLKHLMNPFEPFSPPSTESNSHFDRLTSAINVTPDSGPYNIEQIKADATWLSDQTKINKAAALRIVVLEWQNRSRTRLLWTGGNDADKSFEQQNENFQKSSFFAKPSMISDHQMLAERSTDGFSSDEERQFRLLRLYMLERLHVLRISSLLIRHYLEHTSLGRAKPSKVYIVGEALYSSICKTESTTATMEPTRVDNCIGDFTGALQQRVNKLEAGSGWYASQGGDENLERQWVQLQLDEMVPILHLMFSVVSRVAPSSKATLGYLTLLSERNFFDFNPDQHQDSVTLVKILANLVAAAFFHSDYTLGKLLQNPTSTSKAQDPPFAENTECLQRISEIITDASLEDVNVASLPVYYWVIFLQKWKSMFLEEPTSSFEFLTASKLETLAARALVGLNVLKIMADTARLFRILFKNSPDSGFDDEVRVFLLQILSYSVDAGIIVYNEDVLLPLLAILDAEQPYSVPEKDRLFVSTRPGLIKAYVRPFLEYAFSRFPLEIAPVIRLMRGLLMAGYSEAREYLECLELLHKSNEYTDVLNLEFTNYETLDETFNGADKFLIRTTSELPVFISKPGIHDVAPNGALVPFGQSRWQISSSIDSKIVGEVRHHEPKPLVVTWEFGFSPIGYLMDCLATGVPGSRHVLYSSQEPIALDDAIDIIRLISTVLLALRQNNQVEAFTHAHNLLNHRFCDIDEEKDLVTLVYELFETQLQEQQGQGTSDISINLLTACVEFFDAAAYFSANRIWSILARSRLLDVSGSDPSLVTVVTNFEMVNGTYNFLSSCLQLFSTMVDHAFTITQSKTLSNKKSLSRLGQQAPSVAFPMLPRTSRIVMTVFTRILVSVFENCQFWRFERRDEQSDVNMALMSSFEKILVSVYGFDPEKPLDAKITHPLVDAIADLTDRFLSTNYKKSLTLPILAAISKPIPPQTMILEAQIRSAIQEIQKALSLSITVLHVGTFLHRPQSALESHLFRAVPTLARIFAAAPGLKTPLASLFQVLLLTVPESGTSAPSLLVHMGAETAKSFLVLLTQINQPLRITDQDLAIWRLMTSVVSSRQQWFAFYLLTGRTPRETPSARKKDAEANGCQSQPVYKYALDRIPKMLSNPAEQLLITVHMLRFVAFSYNNWPWAVSMLREHPNFLTSIINYFGSLRYDEGPASMNTIMEALVASEIAEILSMNLHTSRQLGDIQPALDLIQKLGYFKSVGFKPPFLNINMQHRLSSNVDDLYPGLKVSMFQHSQVFPTEYGDNFFYDTETAFKLMEYVTISGRKTKTPNHLNLIQDVKKANVDMSRMQVQLVLHGKCELLATELAQISRLDEKYELVDTLIDIVSACLVNVRGTSELSTAILDKLELRRVDLALLVFQRLASIKDATKVQSLARYFANVWQDLHALIQNSDSLYSGNKVILNRQLLRILFLALQPLAQWNPPVTGKNEKRPEYRVSPAVDYSSELLDILNDVVTNGFKTLANLVHQDQAACEPSDFAIITAILQTILRIPGVETIHQQIALNLANSEVSKYAASLFSWAEQLLVDGDPLYGEHSILFLLELSSIPEMAETLAVEGILARLSSANLMALYTRPNGMGPFDKPTRLHSIWVRGILPLCLNLLDAVGAPVVPEVVSFLAQYPTQLDRLVRELSNRRNPVGPRPGDSYLTVNMASEAHSLALIWRIVEHHRAMGAAAGSMGGDIPQLLWDKPTAKEEIEDWLQARGSVRERLLAANERDAELLQTKSRDGKSENRLEERVWAELTGAAECLGKDS